MPQRTAKPPNIAILYSVLPSTYTLLSKHCSVKALMFFVGRTAKKLSIALCEVRRRRETHLVSYFRNRFVGSFQQAVRHVSYVLRELYRWAKMPVIDFIFPIQLRLLIPISWLIVSTFKSELPRLPCIMVRNFSTN